jgi:hypothetical protein
MFAMPVARQVPKSVAAGFKIGAMQEVAHYSARSRLGGPRSGPHGRSLELRHTARKRDMNASDSRRGTGRIYRSLVSPIERRRPNTRGVRRALMLNTRLLQHESRKLSSILIPKPVYACRMAQHSLLYDFFTVTKYGTISKYVTQALTPCACQQLMYLSNPK